jgi:hypothetical protein
MRGRLINKFMADIRRVDPEATRDVDDGHGNSGMNDVFRELAKVKDADGGAVGTSPRQEMGPLLVPCQVEPLSYKETSMVPDGDDPRSIIKLVFFRRDFERLELIGEDGMPLLRKGDRLESILLKDGVTVQQGFPEGMYLDNFKNDSFGLNMSNPKANLIVAMFKPRPRGING